jgi:hypothetical protein
MTPAQSAAQPGGVLHRVGRAPDPWAWPPWAYAGEGSFGNRFDDPAGEYRVLYASVGPFLETLARYRTDPALVAALKEIADDEEDADRYPTIPPGVMPAHWCKSRRIGAADHDGPFADIGQSSSVAYLRAGWPVDSSTTGSRTWTWASCVAAPRGGSRRRSPATCSSAAWPRTVSGSSESVTCPGSGTTSRTVRAGLRGDQPRGPRSAARPGDTRARDGVIAGSSLRRQSCMTRSPCQSVVDVNRSQLAADDDLVELHPEESGVFQTAEHLATAGKTGDQRQPSALTSHPSPATRERVHAPRHAGGPCRRGACRDGRAGSAGGRSRTAEACA